MKAFVLTISLLALVFAPHQFIFAQSPEMPVPQLILKDADGKLIAPIFSLEHVTIGEGYGTKARVHVVLNFDGNPAIFWIDIYSNDAFLNDKYVFFTTTNCTGQPHLADIGAFSSSHATSYTIVGPDDDTGTYKLYRTIEGETAGPFWSHLSPYGTLCIYGKFDAATLNHAEEVFPNPLAGFRGGAGAGPRFSVEGGTRLP